MERNELRLGNLVTDEWYESFKNIITVTDINQKGIELFIANDGNWTELAQTWIEPEMTFQQLRGIPLNEEWLLKLGFIWDGLYLSKDEYFNVIQDSDQYYYRDYLTISPAIKHVHQLQNLFYCLTGAELELK